MSAFVWVVVGLVAVGFLSGIGKGKQPAHKGPYRIDRPHVMDPDDYECSVCRRRFEKDRMVCPYCDARFSGRVEDEDEFIEEEDELEAWDEEDGV